MAFVTPLILELPFLMSNNVTCNYAKRECLVEYNGKPVNLLNDPELSKMKKPDILAALHQRAHEPPPEDNLNQLENALRKCFQAVFEPLPHTDELPKEPLARIQLNPDAKPLKTRNYACPRKWKEAWHTLLQHIM